MNQITQINTGSSDLSADLSADLSLHDTKPVAARSSINQSAFNEPMYVVPILIEQPTWGGKYIAQYKQLEENQFTESAIGQSYELAKESWVYSGDFVRCYQYAKTSNLASVTEVNVPTNAQPLQSIGPDLARALIKFTQAQENSYQVHVTSDSDQQSTSTNNNTPQNWQPKPESWYFFEEGCATLGLKNLELVAEYKARCEEIDTFAQQLSHAVRQNELNITQARTKLTVFIDQNHPKNYVHTVRIPKNHAVDLSQGGVHHSWEAHPELPFGNIVYEVQKDVKDDVSTLRSFDQGKMKDDGSIRPLTIEDYFSALNTSVENNTPDSLIQTISPEQENIFNTPYYTLKQKSMAPGQTDQLQSNKITHIFIKEGQIQISHPDFIDKKWFLPQGWSLLLPSNAQAFLVQAGTTPATILITH